MINIEKGSIWYRLALYGVFFEEIHMTSNLCPFMRRVMFGVVLIAGYVFLGSLVTMCIGTPPLQVMMAIMHGGEYIIPNLAMVIGSAIWITGALIVVFWFFADTESGEAIRATVNKAYDKLDMDDWIIVQYYQAIHDKICPQLNFGGSIEDGHIKALNEE